MATGTCLCGDVAWKIEDGACTSMVHCHCGTCRKAHGVAYATFVTFAPEAFTWRRGTERIHCYVSSPGSERNFCERCGSKLPSLAPFAYAFAGPLEGELGVTPGAHIFVASKAPWFTLPDDGLPRFDAHAEPDAVAAPTPRHTEPHPGQVRGSCLCGRVAYALERPLTGGGVVSCHCSRCRRARAAAHGSNLFLDASLFTWLRGEDALVAFKLPEAARFAQTFCGDCGSPMSPREATANRRVLPCGTLDDDPGLGPGVHIQVASRAAWETLYTTEPRHDVYPVGPDAATFPPLARRAP